MNRYMCPVKNSFAFEKKSHAVKTISELFRETKERNYYIYCVTCFADLKKFLMLHIMKRLLGKLYYQGFMNEIEKILRSGKWQFCERQKDRFSTLTMKH